MKSFIKEFLIYLTLGLIGVTAIIAWISIIILIVTYIPDGILSTVLILIYSVISAALIMIILNRADREITDKIRGYK